MTLKLGDLAVSVGLVGGWWSAFLRSGIALRFMPDLVRRSSSFLRSSSTRAVVCSWRRVGFLRCGCGGAGQRQLLPPAGTSLGMWTGLSAGVPGWSGDGVGFFPRSGRRSPIRVLPGVQPANEKPRDSQTKTTAGCTPGRSLIASGARPREEPHPTPDHPEPQPTDPSTSRGRCPPEAAVDVDLPHHGTNAGSRSNLTHDPTRAWRTTGGRTTSAVRGPA